MTATAKLKYELLGLTADEYERIKKILRRPPNDVELAVYSLMWSEHCGYKHSRALLKELPTQADYVLQGPGENAGVVDIGDGWAAAMKIESHNHPSAVEPFQGAATGVGGIVRDIFAMGARPLASLNSLRFGPPAESRQKYLFEGVVAGIGSYGNCIGVPTVGGEVYFDESYAGNCLVNAMTVGLLAKDGLIRAGAAGAGNLLLLMGSKTGRDGIGGASILASQEFDQTLQEKRPSVQVGNPFMEKLLIEASLELLEHNLLTALGDLGAAGLTSSAAEMAGRGGVGVDIDVEQVPLREAGMEPWEIMVSESQERMLAVVEPDKLKAATAICRKWGLDWAVVGKITDNGLMRVYQGKKLVGSMPVESLTAAPVYRPTSRKPEYLKTTANFNFKQLDYSRDAGEVLQMLLTSPNLCSRRWIWRQYDHQIQTNTVVLPGADAAVLRLRGGSRGIALTVDGNGRYCYLDPFRGAQIAVAEAARNLACVGAAPLAVTDCLNFGNPEKPPIYWQFEQVIKGLAAACRAFNLPVISGNVSFYNESFGAAIYPTPTIGMLGLLDEVEKHADSAFKAAGDLVVLIGDVGRDGLGGSEYLKVVHNLVSGPPPELDLQVETRHRELCRRATAAGIARSAHDCAEGGLATALAECCFPRELGVTVDLGLEAADPQEAATALFGEAQSRFIVSLRPEKLTAFKSLAAEIGAIYSVIGKVEGDRIKIDDRINLAVKELKNSWQRALGLLVE